jgi:hypothetical protein
LARFLVQSAAALRATIALSNDRIFARFAVALNVRLTLNHDLRDDSRGLA